MTEDEKECKRVAKEVTRRMRGEKTLVKEAQRSKVVSKVVENDGQSFESSGRFRQRDHKSNKGNSHTFDGRYSTEVKQKP